MKRTTETQQRMNFKMTKSSERGTHSSAKPPKSKRKGSEVEYVQKKTSERKTNQETPEYQTVFNGGRSHSKSLDESEWVPKESKSQKAIPVSFEAPRNSTKEETQAIFSIEKEPTEQKEEPQKDKETEAERQEETKEVSKQAESKTEETPSEKPQNEYLIQSRSDPKEDENERNDSMESKKEERLLESKLKEPLEEMTSRDKTFELNDHSKEDENKGILMSQEVSSINLSKTLESFSDEENKYLSLPFGKRNEKQGSIPDQDLPIPFNIALWPFQNPQTPKKTLKFLNENQGASEAKTADASNEKKPFFRKPPPPPLKFMATKEEATQTSTRTQLYFNKTNSKTREEACCSVF